MKRVFVFCIGGTGLRVMKSITMLLAAGMKADDYIVVPIIIDPHLDLEEKRNLQNLLNEYAEINDSVTSSDGKRLNPIKGFFSTQITDLAKLNGLQNDLTEPISEKRSFGDFLNVGKLESSDVNNYLIQTLFSQANLDNDLSVGFKGSPNVGTVVLGEMIQKANWFDSFKDACQQGDRVFIISSIFGGTGASGFPLLEKKIRQYNDSPAVKEALVGAVTVLPYFSLDDPSITDSDIDSGTFLTKTKSALSYYEKHVNPDYLYYVGEQSLKTVYNNNEKEQKDIAHFIELVAATAFFDFLEREEPDTPQCLTRSIKDDKESLSSISLGREYNDVVKCIADMMILSRLVHILPDEKYFPLKKNRGFDKNFYKHKSFMNLKAFLSKFHGWYKELESNKRSFSPLTIADLKDRKANLSNFIQDFSLDANDESYYLLEMIKSSNRNIDKSHNVKMRFFLESAYSAIDTYTKNFID
jgi:hypothetical protein